MYTEDGMKDYFDSFPNPKNRSEIFKQQQEPIFKWEPTPLQGNFIDVDLLINNLHDLSYTELLEVHKIIVLLMEKKVCK